MVQVVQLEFQHLDVNNPNYQFVQFGSLPISSLFRDEKQFKIKMSNKYGMILGTEVYRSIPDTQFVLTSCPVKLCEYIEN